MFRVVVPFWNCEDYIETCLVSLLEQSYKDWECVIIDDISTDGSAKKVENIIAGDSRFYYYKNVVRKMYPLGNHISAALTQRDKVIVCLDADDWFYNEDSLAIVADYYKSNKDLKMTWGQFQYSDGRPGISANVTCTTHEIRSHPWCMSHLKTFKPSLLKYAYTINKLIDPRTDRYFGMAGDMALMMALYENTQPHERQFIPEILYTYNCENQNSEWSLDRESQLETEKVIRSL